MTDLCTQHSCPSQPSRLSYYNSVQKLLCGLVVPHEVKAQGSASLAALSALCMYLKRCNANQELATGTHKVAITYTNPFPCLLRLLMTPVVESFALSDKHRMLMAALQAAYMCNHFHAAHEMGLLLHR